MEIYESMLSSGCMLIRVSIIIVIDCLYLWIYY